MGTGIRAEIVVREPRHCQVVGVSEDGDAVTSVSRGGSPTAEGTVSEEFTVAGGDPDAETGFDDIDAEPVFEYEDGGVYRFERDPLQGCVCELVERQGCPVRDVTARDGRLFVTFFATDLATLRETVQDLKAAAGGVSVRRLTQSDAGDQGSDVVLVDRAALTDRQRETLTTAHEMGYFDHPKGANAGEVADELGVSRSTFAEHLAAAQRKLLCGLLAE